MRAHLVQMDIAWEDPEANHEKVGRLLDRAGVDDGDLVVLPEMFDTGFSLDTEKTADTTGRTLRFLCDLAADLRATVQGARTVRNDHGALARNMATVVGPEGDVIAEYAKVHPFSYGREPDAFESGREVVVYEWGKGRRDAGTEGRSEGHAAGLTVCPAVCYDLRFPELFRLGLLKGAEGYAIGANWPASRAAHWRALLIARAIENQAFVFGVNRAGRDPNLEYAGGTIAVGPRGEVMGELGAEEGVLSVEVDRRELDTWRGKFPAWKDVKLIGGRGTTTGPATSGR